MPCRWLGRDLADESDVLELVGSRLEGQAWADPVVVAFYGVGGQLDGVSGGHASRDARPALDLTRSEREVLSTRSVVEEHPVDRIVVRALDHPGLIGDHAAFRGLAARERGGARLARRAAERLSSRVAQPLRGRTEDPG